MNNLPLARRGPFRIAGFSYKKRLAAFTGLCFCPLAELQYQRDGKPIYWISKQRGPVPWYRKLSFKDRGPFALKGWCPLPQRMGPVIWVFWLRVHRFSRDPMRYAGATGWTAPWIYYSGNISNGPICH
jgi:hypothetical protein